MSVEPPSTEILARCLDDYQERGEVALREACERHPELAPRLREAAEAVRELLRVAAFEPGEIPGSPWMDEARFGRFEILRRIGAGGMGVVFEAQDPQLQRKVALKVLAIGGSDPDGRADRFQREGRALARLRHPHIVPVLEVGTGLEQRPYLVMPLVQGTSLAQLLERQEAKPPRSYWLELAGRLANIAEALQHAHEQGLIHRDVKPGNILVDERGTVVLIDFGIARLEGAASLTASRSMLGTPAFMAPEQIRAPDRIGPGTDVYGLGATLYQCLTKRLPFEATSHAECYDDICRRVPPAPRLLRPSIPKELETICLRAMSKEIGHRYAEAGQLAEDLRRFTEGRPIHARPIGPIRRSWRWALRNRYAAVALLLGLLLLTAGPLAYAWHQRGLASQERASAREIRAQSEERLRAQAVAAYRAGRLFAQRGRWESALAQYDLAAAHPDPVLVGIGRVEALEGRFDIAAANQILDSLLEQELPPHHEAKLLLLEADLGVDRLRQPDDKLDLVRRALSMNTLTPADERLARAMLARTVSEALTQLRAARVIDPSHRRVNDCLVVALLASGKLRELRVLCRELRSLYPEDPVATLLETLLRELDGRPVANEEAVGTGDARVDAQLLFVRSAARFIRLYDEIVRDMCLDAAFRRKNTGAAKLRAHIWPMAMQAMAFLRSRRSRGPGEHFHFRLLPVVAATYTDLLKKGIRYFAGGLFGKRDPAVMRSLLAEASTKIGDAVFAQAAGVWAGTNEDWPTALECFERAVHGESMILQPFTAMLMRVQARRQVLVRIPRDDTAKREPHLAALREEIGAALDANPERPDEARYLFEVARGFGLREPEMRAALHWRRLDPNPKSLARRAVELAREDLR